MRGLSKPWPPADVSPAGQGPRRFVDVEQEYLNVLPNAGNRTAFARAQFEQLDKTRVRAVMYREQRNLCVYCERSVGEGPTPPHIEHWRPLSRSHEVALHWRNLYLSCPSIDTCDASKGDRPLKWADADPDLPWPTDLSFENLVGFTSRGEIYVRGDVALDRATRKALELAIDDQPEDGRVRQSILVLNHPTLVAARAAGIKPIPS